ncbi:MAG: hypothetical protein LBT40_11985 [Deltaproteobacteria bacterium]|nr:hypothetical protein [Deltaproteobacteria bacterium]
MKTLSSDMRSVPYPPLGIPQGSSLFIQLPALDGFECPRSGCPDRRFPRLASAGRGPAVSPGGLVRPVLWGGAAGGPACQALPVFGGLGLVSPAGHAWNLDTGNPHGDWEALSSPSPDFRTIAQPRLSGRRQCVRNCPIRTGLRPPGSPSPRPNLAGWGCGTDCPAVSRAMSSFSSDNMMRLNVVPAAAALPCGLGLVREIGLAPAAGRLFSFSGLPAAMMPTSASCARPSAVPAGHVLHPSAPGRGAVSRPGTAFFCSGGSGSPAFSMPAPPSSGSSTMSGGRPAGGSPDISPVLPGPEPEAPGEAGSMAVGSGPGQYSAQLPDEAKPADTADGRGAPAESPDQDRQAVLYIPVAPGALLEAQGAREFQGGQLIQEDQGVQVARGAQEAPGTDVSDETAASGDVAAGGAADSVPMPELPRFSTGCPFPVAAGGSGAPWGPRSPAETQSEERHFQAVLSGETTRLALSMLHAVKSSLQDSGRVQRAFTPLLEDFRRFLSRGITINHVAGMAVMDALSEPLVSYVSCGRSGTDNPLGRAFGRLRRALDTCSHWTSLRAREIYWELLRQRAWPVPGPAVPAGSDPVLIEAVDEEYRRVFRASFPYGFVFPRAACPPVALADFAARSAVEALERSSENKPFGTELVAMDLFPGTGTHAARLVALGLAGTGPELLDKYLGTAVLCCATDPMSYHISAMKMEEAFRSVLGPAMPRTPYLGVSLDDPANRMDPLGRRGESPLSENVASQQKLRSGGANIVLGTPPFPGDGLPRKGGGRRRLPCGPDDRSDRRGNGAGAISQAGLEAAKGSLGNLVRCCNALDGRFGALAVTTDCRWALLSSAGQVRSVMEQHFGNVSIMKYLAGHVTTRSRLRKAAAGGSWAFGPGHLSPQLALTVLARGASGPKGFLMGTLPGRRRTCGGDGYAGGPSHVFGEGIDWRPVPQGTIDERALPGSREGDGAPARKGSRPQDARPSRGARQAPAPAPLVKRRPGRSRATPDVPVAGSGQDGDPGTAGAGTGGQP